MDTPERIQSTAPLSKFEDSPVFNYINSLSPIKPVKSVHFTQTFNTLSFASLPSVFTSPHVSSLKDSKFLKRHYFYDPSKPEHTSEDAEKAETGDENLNVTQNPLKPHTDGDSVTFVMQSNSYSNLEARKLSYEAVILDTNALKMTGPSASSVPFINDGSENGPFRIETETEGINQLPHSKEVAECDWDCLISGDTELLNFNSPSDTVIALMNVEPQADDDHPSENEEGVKGPAENPAIVAGTSLNNNFEAGESVEETDNEGGFNLYRGTRRRCLVFDMRKHLEDVPNDNNLHLLNNGNENVNGNDSSGCIMPGIGLHLNAITSNLTDNKVVKHGSSGPGTGRQLIISPSAPYPSMGSGQELITTLLDEPSFENEVEPTLNVVEDASKAPGFVVNDELSQSQSSPRKKRRKAESAGEAEACKRCNCKKSKCLKLYCECFAAGVYCVEPCSCQECFNKPIHEDTVLATRKQIESRDPLAFAPKVIKTSDLTEEDESTNTPASARHKRGCSCKKSGCLKKYCECYQGGVGCSISCRCKGCKNTFGRKDGSGMNLEFNECDGNGSDGSLQMALHNEAEPVSTVPATPSRFGRQSILSSKGKPPRSFLAMGSSSNQRLGKLNPWRGKQLEAVGEDEIPGILEEKNGVKSCSPNSKRVSPPHSTSMVQRSSMGHKSSRKLILQSIPSFPCLTPNTNK